MFDWYKPSISSDELYHWKYKRKYRGPSGDWVYVYDDGSMSTKGSTSQSVNETDAWGNSETYTKQIVTNPNNWLTKKYSSEQVTTDSVTEDGHTHGRSHRTVTETIERGKLHMAKMDFMRRVSEIPKTIKRDVKEHKAWDKYAKKNNIKYDRYDTKKYEKEHEKWAKKYRKKRASDYSDMGY